MTVTSKDKQILEKIVKHIDRIMKYSHRCEDYYDFENDTMCVEACVFNLMQIGELAKVGLSEEVKHSITSVPWKQVYGMRNRITHDYEGVNMSIVWDTIQEDLPRLKMDIVKVLGAGESGEDE